jgi:hypothetical protein
LNSEENQKCKTAANDEKLFHNSIRSIFASSNWIDQRLSSRLRQTK